MALTPGDPEPACTKNPGLLSGKVAPNDRKTAEFLSFAAFSMKRWGKDLSIAGEQGAWQNRRDGIKGRLRDRRPIFLKESILPPWSKRK
jgi:hypothetical protein